MALISIPFTFSAGAVIIASQHNSNFSTIYSDYNGNIDNTNIVSNAAIVASKLDLTSPGAIGSTAASTGKFTTLEATSTLKLATTHQGDVLYDNGTSLVRLTPGTSGQFLKTLGAAANPAWATINGFVPTNIQVFITSGTWTKPAAVSNVYVKVIGAGGAGATEGGGVSGCGGGGGGGGYAEGIIAVTGDVTVTIGATNSFAGTTTIQSTSGSAGSSGAGASAGAGGAGGAGSNGTINLTGQTGGTGITTLMSGYGGSSVMGAGANGVKGGANGGVAGKGYGGGGSGGGGDSQTGGAGDAGAVIVYY